MPKVEVIINPKDGTIQYELEGFEGNSCDEITRRIRENNEELEYQQTSEWCEEQELPAYNEEME